MDLLTETGWTAPPTTDAPSLTADVTCDVAVIGGGVGGGIAALRLAESGADTVLVEAQTCGSGASSRNAGYVTNSIAADPALLALLLSRSKLRALFQFAEAAVQFTQTAIENRCIDCDFDEVRIVHAAVSKVQLRKARRNARIMAEPGSSAQFVDGRDVGPPESFLGGMREGAGGVLNPAKFSFGLRRAVFASGARVFEHTQVKDLTDRKNRGDYRDSQRPRTC